VDQDSLDENQTPCPLRIEIKDRRVNHAVDANHPSQLLDRVGIDFDAMVRLCWVQQLERLQIHPNVGTELDTGTYIARSAQRLGEKIQIGCQQGVALISLDVGSAEFTGPEGFLFGLVGHGASLIVSGSARFCSTCWLIRIQS
jgi:hypothetical protein